MRNIKLSNDFLNVQVGEGETWKITNDLIADWSLDKIRDIQAEYSRFEIVAKAKIEQIKAKMEQEKTKADYDTEFFESKLREYFETVKTKDTKTLKKYSLPSGNLKLTKAKNAFDYDKDKLLNVAKEKGLNDYIKTVESFKWVEFKKKLDINNNKIINKETGEIVELDGLKIIEKPEKFKVEI